MDNTVVGISTNSIADTLTFYDLQRLPKNILTDVMEQMGEDPKQVSKQVMAEMIWAEIKTNRSMRNELLEPHELNLFTNKVTTSYYKTASLKDLKEKIIAKEGTEVITNQIEIDDESINSIPKIFSICDCPEQIFGKNKFMLRFLYQNGFYYIPTPEGNNQIKKIQTITALVDEENGIIEIRSNTTASKKIPTILANYFEDRPQIDKLNILFKHNETTENLARALQGKLLESSGEPTLPLEDLNDNQVQEIQNILDVIDIGLSQKNSEAIDYSSVIDSASEVIFEEQSPVPFLALILAGLDKVSLKTFVESLVTSPLYKSLAPYLTNHGGYISFSVTFKSLLDEHTIQVAKQSNTIYFPGNSNEVAIKKVRDAIL
ncbi:MULTISPECIES: hypothetical protein [Enterococcus]|uniref:Uncharacterized protein n=1 Tax=Enterococcus gallinarum TaxID=1353 RepID=A0ABD4HPB5_ENTGA|nr:hypothetical protein [Enterococcus gallinarum]MBA0948695.1 hypothetical protein [Enterococcus gallinarum]MBA0961727.1 hypothetical protein [Enterococcus gallinarum]MBA0969664.1 hypothetical protein [Enterococcus gallinarum]MBA0973026.1 hypothetical protein [Enterococcus gallinarum]NVI95070.1 hypothetical protein [Enterococcus gallinarum]